MDTDVIVVGAGPVGLMLAGELRLGGAGVVVLDRLAEPTTESRASTLHARTMEIFDQRGLLGTLGTPPNEPAGHFGGIPLVLSGLSTRYPGQWKVLQARVEELLAAWAIGLGADLRREHDVTGLDAGDDRVRVRAGSVELTARYVVGCDGEDSTVRRLAGIEFAGRDATHELLRADVAGIDVPNRRFERLAGGLAISSRRPDGVTRVMVSAFDRPVGHRAAPPSFVEICKVWEQVTGEDIRHGTPLWRNAFGNASRLARRYRAGRVLLAGDAAHQQMPAGGQAINLGLQDAANLGWKLAAEVSGRAPEWLLDSYHDERHEVGRRVLANIEAQALLLLGGQEVDPTRTLLTELIGYPVVRDRLAAMISGLDVRYGEDANPLVGARMPHLDRTVRAGRGVLLDSSGDPDRHARLRATVAPWADRMELLVCPPPDHPSTWDTALLRPDGHVAWVGDRDSDPRPQLSHWFGDPDHS
jgi:2-polyprenyl-6-methoxyphenol hydroxylase-like FAD-dependent oxidoreductase